MGKKKKKVQGEEQTARKKKKANLENSLQEIRISVEILSRAGTFRMGSAQRDGTAFFDCFQAIFGPLSLRSTSGEIFNFKSQFLAFQHFAEDLLICCFAYLQSEV